MGWSHGKKWTDEEIERILLDIAVAIHRLPSTSDLRSNNREDILQALRYRGGLRKWQDKISNNFAITQTSCILQSKENNDSHKLANENNSLSNDDNKLANENNSLSNDSRKLMNDSHKLANENNSLSNENNSLSNENNSLSNDDTDLSNENNSLTNENNSLSNENNSLSNDDNSLTCPIDEGKSSNINHFETKAVETNQKTSKKLNYFRLMEKAGLTPSMFPVADQSNETQEVQLNKDENKSKSINKHVKSINKHDRSIKLTLNNLTYEQSVFDIPDTSKNHLLPESEVKSTAARLFVIWAKVTKKTNRVRLTPKKVKAAGARLRQGYTEQNLEQAIRGFGASPWHNGKNPAGKCYNDFAWIMKDGDKVEQGIGYYVDLVKRPAEKMEHEKAMEQNQQIQIEQETLRRKKIMDARNSSLPKPKSECTEISLEEVEEMVFGKDREK